MLTLNVNRGRPRQSERIVVTGEARHTRWSLVALGVSVSAFGAYLQFKLPPVLPEFLAQHPHSPQIAAGFMSVFALVGLAASAPLGRLLGQRALIQALLAGLVLAGIGVSLGLAAPHSASLMLLARGAEGLTFALFALIGPVIANRGAARRDLGIVTGLLAAWIPIGQLGAGLLALGGAGWQALWIVNLLLIPLLALAAWQQRAALGPNALGPDALGPDVMRTRAAPAKLAGRHPSHGNPGEIAWALQARRALAIGAAVFLLWSLQFFAFMTWLTQYLTGELGLGAQAAILAYLLPVLVVMLFNLASGYALARGLPLLPALISALLLQALVWLLAPHAAGATGIPLLILYGVGAGIAPACFFHLPHHLAHTGEGGGDRVGPGAYGVLMTGRNCGVFLGPIAMAALFGGPLGWSGAALVIAGITIAAALLALALGGMKPGDPHR